MPYRLTPDSAAWWLAVALIPGSLALGRVEAATSSAPATVVDLMKRSLEGDADREVLMLTVTYPAAGSSLPHRHDAQVFVYVLEGTLTMQVRGSPALLLKPGDTFYEGSDDVHVVSANTSKRKPAKILVVMIKDRRKPVSVEVTEQEKSDGKPDH